MAISTVTVDFSAILQNAAQATGLLRVRLSQVGTVEDSETGDTVILPITWQETTLTDGAATLALVPNKLIEPSCTYYEIQLKSIPDCPKACAKLLLSGIMYVPDEDCNVLDLLISPPSPETANTASGYASQAKQAAQVAEYFAVQAGDRYDDVAEAAATALTDIGTAKQDALDAIGTAQSEATEAISTAQGTAIGAVQAEGNTQVGRVEDAGEDAVADVTAAQATAVSAVQAQQATSVAAVTAEGTRQTGLVTAEGTAQVNAVTQAGNGYVSTMQGLVSDAQAARDAAQTAQGLAEDARAAAESASADAQGYAGDASTSAGHAAQSASDAADSATAAQASAESIAASAAQIQTNEDNITALETKTDITNKNVSNIQALLNGTLYREETDSTEAYSKTVPTGAMPYASINEIGGKTVVWNQLVNPLTDANMQWQSFSTRENTDGIVKVTVTQETEVSNAANNVYIFRYRPLGGTRLKTQGDVLYVACSIRVSRRYSFYLVPYYMNVGTCDVEPSTNFQTFSFIGTNPVSSSSPDTNSFFINSVANTQTVYPGDVFEFKDPIVINLTQMFGAGNEPATVAEFEAMFPSIDPAYNAGTLISAGAAGAVSVGRNLWDMSERTVGDFGAAMATTTRNISEQHYYCALAANNYYSKGVGTVTLFDGGFSYTGADTAYYGVAIPFKVVPGEIYVISGNFSSTVIGYERNMYYDENGNYISFTSSSPLGTSFSANITQIPLNARWVLIQFVVNTANTGFSVSNIQLERGSTTTAYTPYRAPSTLPIPAAVQALPGYGWSAGTVYNYIDWQRKVYIQRVGSYTITGAESFGTWGDAHYASNVLSESNRAPSSNANTNLICNKYEGKASGALYSDTTSLAVGINGRALYLSSAAYSAGGYAGAVIYYELATTVETDISSLLSDDNLIAVEPGGTISFPSSLGDDYRIPVPSTEEYTIDLAPDTPSTDGIYTLQCTVTDGTPSVTWVTA